MADLNLSGLSQATTAAGALSGLILVSPQSIQGYQPQNSPSWQRDTTNPAPAILFNYEGEQTGTITSDITDHYIEDNSAVQDQIALKPVTITTQGFVGELNDIAPALLLPLKIIAEKLTVISAYTPQLSVTALEAYNIAFQTYQTAQSLINSAVGAWSSINGGSGATVINGSTVLDPNNLNKNQTQQQVYFQQFYGYWQKRTLFTIQTPWAIFQDMAILNLRAVQDAETRMISDFEVTFKQLRFASTLLTELDPNTNSLNFTGRLQSQGASENFLGVQTLLPSDTSFSSTIPGQ